MSNTKFKVGDRVKLIRAAEMCIPNNYLGKEGVISEISEENYMVNLFGDDDCDFWYVGDEDLEHAVRQCFVVVDAADNVTAEHPSLEAAEDDARLSSESCNEAFTVYQRIVTFTQKSETVEVRG